MHTKYVIQGLHFLWNPQFSVLHWNKRYYSLQQGLPTPLEDSGSRFLFALCDHPGGIILQMDCKQSSKGQAIRAPLSFGMSLRGGEVVWLRAARTWAWLHTCQGFPPLGLLWPQLTGKAEGMGIFVFCLHNFPAEGQRTWSQAQSPLPQLKPEGTFPLPVVARLCKMLGLRGVGGMSGAQRTNDLERDRTRSEAVTSPQPPWEFRHLTTPSLQWAWGA